jgi:threonine dehydrogenase-like Zn-dependent dehydrogenase
MELEQRSRPEPKTGEEEIVIEVAGVCGSISRFLGHSALRRPPLVLGHELVGRRREHRRVVANPLVSCGTASRAFLAGRICANRGSCSAWDYSGPSRNTSRCYTQVYEIPDSLTSEQAILAEPLANIVHLFRLVSPPPFFRLAIVGAGTMGALAVSAAMRIGARDVLAADVNEQRLETMRKLGTSSTVNAGTADAVADAIRNAGRGCDVVIDASGSAPARQLAFDFCRPGGQVVLLGMGTQRSEVNFVTSIRKEHRVVMSFAYTPVDLKIA